MTDTLFPTALDDFTNPLGTNDQGLLDHALIHRKANDAIAALQRKVGVDSSEQEESHDFKIAYLLDALSSVSPGGPGELSRIITVSTESSSVEDWDPPGLSDANVILASPPDFMDFTIGGLAGGAPGRMILLINASAAVMSLVRGSGSSAAANRFVICDVADSASLAVPALGSVLLWHDNSVFPQWWIVAKSFGIGGGTSFPSGTGFVHVVDGAPDGAAITATGSGDVVLSSEPTLESAQLSGTTHVAKASDPAVPSICVTGSTSKGFGPAGYNGSFWVFAANGQSLVAIGSMNRPGVMLSKDNECGFSFGDHTEWVDTPNAVASIMYVAPGVMKLTDGTTDGFAGTALVLGVQSVSELPSAASVGAGARATVSDATATTFASLVAGGGSKVVPVYSDGTDWLIG